MFDQLSNVGVFSKIDLHFGYQHLRVKEGEIPKIVFRTWRVHYEFKSDTFWT